MIGNAAQNIIVKQSPGKKTIFLFCNFKSLFFHETIENILLIRLKEHWFVENGMRLQRLTI